MSTAGLRQRREGRETARRSPTRDGIPRCFPGAGLRKARHPRSRTLACDQTPTAASLCRTKSPTLALSRGCTRMHACSIAPTSRCTHTIGAREAPLHRNTLPPHGAHRAHPHPAGSLGPQCCGVVRAGRAASPISRPAAAAPCRAAAERSSAAPLFPGSRDVSAGKNVTRPAWGIAATAGPGHRAASSAGSEENAEPVLPALCRSPAPIGAALCSCPVPPRRAGAQ